MAVNTDYSNNSLYLLRLQQQAKTQAQTSGQSGDNGTTSAVGATAQTTPAYQVNIAANGAENDTKVTNAEGVESGKGLTADQIQALRDDMVQQQQNFLSQMTQRTIVNQAGLSSASDGNTSALSLVKFGMEGDNGISFELPEVGKTAEEAKAAISEGGQYSVDAVAERVVSMAQNIANGDADKLETMRSAIQKGFEKAGAQFSKIYGNQDMPQITQDTQSEIMKRLDNVKASYQQQTQDQEQKVNSATEKEM
ncbi:MAG: hypothetical protein ACI4OA_09795 [Selenomonadaceae bacterium]